MKYFKGKKTCFFTSLPMISDRVFPTTAANTWNGLPPSEVTSSF